MTWKTITVPRTLYLPTGSTEGSFKHTGHRVEPHDKIEIDTTPESHRIRINGIDHTLLRATSTLRLDAKNCLVLDKPQEVIISPPGQGTAFVGRFGEAIAAARGRWDHEEVANWEGDGASHIGRDQINAQIRHAATQGAFDDSEMGDDDSTPKGGGNEEVIIAEFFTEFEEALRASTADTEVRPVTLKDGTRGFALFDKQTGTQIGSTNRTYTPKYDASGHQVGQRLDYHGPNASGQQGGVGFTYRPNAAFDQETLRRKVQEQATPVRALRSTPVQPPTPPKQTQPAAPFNHTTLDGFLEATLGCRGLPIGSITYIACDEDILQVEPNASCSSLEMAFARIHLLPPNQRPLILVKLGPTPTDTLRLALAEQLPVLSQMIKNHGKVAVALTSPLWPVDVTPILLPFVADLHLRIAPHEQDTRFFTATLLKGGSGSVSFPR